MSSFCPSDVTLIRFLHLSTTVLEGCRVCVSVSDLDVDVGSGLDWGVLLLFLSSCSSSSFCFCRSPSQHLISSSLLCSLVSFTSSESDQSDLRCMGYLVGHHFLVGVHIAQYLREFWD